MAAEHSRTRRHFATGGAIAGEIADACCAHGYEPHRPVEPQRPRAARVTTRVYAGLAHEVHARELADVATFLGAALK